MPVAVIVPWRGGCADRERAWEHISALYARHHPDWPVTVAEAPAGPWCKASAVMPAALSAGTEVLVIADADVWCDGLADAVAAIQAGSAWTVPHLQVQRLTAEATARWCSGDPANDLPVAQPLYEGVPGGGIVVIGRDLLERVPLDPRFIGWGGEDHAWGYALETLAGPPWRGSTPLVHLWHPPPGRRTRLVGNRENEELRQAYYWARASRPRMQHLVDEARRALVEPTAVAV